MTVGASLYGVLPERSGHTEEEEAYGKPSQTAANDAGLRVKLEPYEINDVLRYLMTL
jgi:hypothetical protein